MLILLICMKCPSLFCFIYANTIRLHFGNLTWAWLKLKAWIECTSLGLHVLLTKHLFRTNWWPLEWFRVVLNHFATKISRIHFCWPRLLTNNAFLLKDRFLSQKQTQCRSRVARRSTWSMVANYAALESTGRWFTSTSFFLGEKRVQNNGSQTRCHPKNF